MSNIFTVSTRIATAFQLNSRHRKAVGSFSRPEDYCFTTVQAAIQFCNNTAGRTVNSICACCRQPVPVTPLIWKVSSTVNGLDTLVSEEDDRGNIYTIQETILLND